MQVRPEIFAFSVILFVPLAYATFSIQDACAAPVSPRYQTGTCSGMPQDSAGKTCCWREPVEGKLLGERYCQTCYKTWDEVTETFTETCTTPEKQAVAPLRPELSGTLDEGGVIEGNRTTPDSDQKTGIFKDPIENNDTFSQDDIGNLD